MTATLTSLGELLLPKAEAMGKWLTSFTSLITKNKLAGGIFDGTLIAGALILGSLKLLKVVNALRAAFGLGEVILSAAPVAAAIVAAAPVIATAAVGGAVGYGTVKLVQSESAKVWAGAADAQHPWGSGGTMPTLAGQHIIRANAKGDQAYISNAQFAQLVKEVQSASKSGHRMSDAQIYAEVRRMAIADVKNIPQYKTQLANQGKTTFNVTIRAH